ncbi:MAG TPA: PDZ domain-containing protein [Candidatus Hydrogenedentes bacterium]|nr:PDZ domain-containing protein [Candidatus Hydrogenedentota bacterium]
MKTSHSRPFTYLKSGLAVVLVGCMSAVFAEDVSPTFQETVERAVGKVKPALVRIEVVSADYWDGREVKHEASGSGVIITPEGHVVTNHHVAGDATLLLCTLSTKEEIEAELVGKDPLTDIAVIKLKPEKSRTFPVAEFGDSSKVRAGDHVLAMGSPLSLSQSVTLGIISNTELVMPKWMGRGGLTLDGEDVGALVRWFGHDAQIYGGNSGGPLVNMAGQIIGINEIKIGLGGAIPGNVVKDVAEMLIKEGKVRRSWLGITIQPRLKHGNAGRGVLVSGTFKDSPAEKAGVKSGDVLVRFAGQDVDVRFPEELPAFNRLVAGLPVGEPVEVVVLRGGEEIVLSVTTIEREKIYPQQHEIKEWGITVRNMSDLLAKTMKRDSAEGVLVTSIRPGGPAGDAKPAIFRQDVLVEVNGKPIENVQELRDVTAEIVQGQDDPVPTLVGFERKTERYLTVVKVGIKDIEDPGLEVKKAWLPVQTQVLTRDIATELGDRKLKGFVFTQVFEGSTAETAGLEVGDFILAVDGEPLEASAPEDYEELPALIRQYKIGSVADLTVLRDAEKRTIAVELIRSPKLSREMKKYRDDNFEFTVRDITFFDKAEERWKEEEKGVLVEQVESGGWAALGQLRPGDLIQQVDDTVIADVEALETKMDAVVAAEPKAVVFKVGRGVYTVYLEFEPKWETTETQ